MDSVDLAVLRRARDWMRDGYGVTLMTVVQTWGSAPRPVGALLALRGDGRIEGSVSGGCIEDDLLARSAFQTPKACEVITYGVTREESSRFGLPCGGTLRLIQEPVMCSDWLDELLTRCANHERVTRQLDLATGEVTIHPCTHLEPLAFEGAVLRAPFGPSWRILMIGAGQLSRYAADLAVGLGFEVLICDPRDTYRHDWSADFQVQFVPGMPDDAVRAIEPDAHTAVVALTHDPRLDDLALLAALESPAFYVGALGSRANNGKRRSRLRSLGLSEEAVARLHGPIGIAIGSRTPAEIALSMMAQIVAIKNQLTAGEVPVPARVQHCA